MVQPRQIIEALRDIETVFQRFSGLTTNQLRQIEQVIFGWERRLQQRQMEVEREYQTAKADLNACLNSGDSDEDGNRNVPDCSAYEQRIYEIEQVLYKLQALITTLDNVAREYRAKASQMQGFVEDTIPSATNWLRHRQDALERFEQSGNGFGSASTGTVSNAGASATNLSTSSKGVSPAAGFGSSSYKRVDHGIVNISVSELPEPDITGEQDFQKVSVSDMRDGLTKLQEIQSVVQQKQGLNTDYWSQIDRDRGLSYENGYQRVYEAFYGDTHIRVEKVDGEYNIINGRHRIWLAKRMGITNLPIELIELHKQT